MYDIDKGGMNSFFKACAEKSADEIVQVIDLFDIEKALVLSFLLFLLDTTDVLLRKDQKNDKKLRISLIGFEFSMKETVKQWPTFLFVEFKNHHLEQLPSEDIRKIVENLSKQMFEELFEKIRLIQSYRENFYGRLEALKKGFQTHKTLWDIFSKLFEERFFTLEKNQQKAMMLRAIINMMISAGVTLGAPVLFAYIWNHRFNLMSRFKALLGK